jgi:hypothetical protein
MLVDEEIAWTSPVWFSAEQSEREHDQHHDHDHAPDEQVDGQ